MWVALDYLLNICEKKNNFWNLTNIISDVLGTCNLHEQ